MGDVAPQAVRIVWHGSLTPPWGVDAGQSVGRTSSSSAGRTGPTWQGRLLSGQHRLFLRQGVKKEAPTGPNPTDRAKAGSQYHLLVDVQGLPLTESVTAASVHDRHELFPLVDSVPRVKMPSGQRQRCPRTLHGDKAYASTQIRWRLRLRGISPRIARPRSESNECLGRFRWGGAHFCLEESAPLSPCSR
ncbi:transposase [Myxococcus guangdongensis]|uniref:transposase n=1 Tax=Myxococcus guangdongensis TaxID=2906760 RepID=UPI0038994606